MLIRAGLLNLEGPPHQYDYLDRALQHRRGSNDVGLEVISDLTERDRAGNITRVISGVDENGRRFVEHLWCMRIPRYKLLL